MASKLGLSKGDHSSGQLCQLTNEEKRQAKANVKSMIREIHHWRNEFSHKEEGQDYSNVQIESSSALLETPKSFRGELKSYQIKGLRWLDNLYSQGINGILADEMGLGKTIQAIALMCHLSENKNNFGPFLIIAPTVTLFNWLNEIEKFSQELKCLAYWGSLKEWKILKKFFQ